MFKAVAGVNVGAQSYSVLTREEGAQVIPVINTNRELADEDCMKDVRAGRAQRDCANRRDMDQADGRQRPHRDTD